MCNGQSAWSKLYSLMFEPESFYCLYSLEILIFQLFLQTQWNGGMRCEVTGHISGPLVRSHIPVFRDLGRCLQLPV